MLCVGVTLVMLAVTLVGTMLSVGSRYQEMVFAKKWEGGFPPKGNGSAVEPFAPLGEPFVIIPDAGSVVGGGAVLSSRGVRRPLAMLIHTPDDVAGSPGIGCWYVGAA